MSGMIPDGTDHLPEEFSFTVKRMPDGFWKVTSAAVHDGLRMAGQDLGALLFDAPHVLNHLLKLDGPALEPKEPPHE